jgi:hypothetical protein
LGKIKFNDDFDFTEMQEFVGSPIIAEIFKRLHKEYLAESKKRGYINESHISKFNIEGIEGRTLKKRLDELPKKEIQNMIKNNELEDYVKILLIPLEYEKKDFQQLLEICYEKLTSSKYTKEKIRLITSPKNKL